MEGERSVYFGRKIFFIFLMLLAIGVYLSWGLIAVIEENLSVIDAFTDIGLYSFTVIPFLFGLFGWLLYRAKEREGSGDL